MFTSTAWGIFIILIKFSCLTIVHWCGAAIILPPLRVGIYMVCVRVCMCVCVVRLLRICVQIGVYNYTIRVHALEGPHTHSVK